MLSYKAECTFSKLYHKLLVLRPFTGIQNVKGVESARRRNKPDVRERTRAIQIVHACLVFPNIIHNAYTLNLKSYNLLLPALRRSS